MNPHTFIVAVTVVSMVTCILTVISIATDHWIEATAILTESLQSNVSYGLFEGSMERQQLASSVKFTLTLVCDFEANACMYSCQRDSHLRHVELKRVLHQQDLDPCEQKRLYAATLRSHHDYVNSTNEPLKTHTSSSKIPSSVPYISSSIHLCSVMFLCLGFAFSLMALTCSCINLRWHPVERVFNIYGLYIWNSIAAGCSFWSVALWAALFGNHLRYNIAITDTLRQHLNFTSEGYARLGYSFHLIIVIISLHIINLILLFVRRYWLEKQPREPPNNMSSDYTVTRLEFY